MAKKKKVVTEYDDMSLPALCKLCNDRGIKNYFEMDDDEIRLVLTEWDKNNTKKGDEMAKKKEADDLESLEEIELDDDLDESNDAEIEDDDELDESNDDEKLDDLDDDEKLDDLDDEIEDEPEPKEKEVAKKEKANTEKKKSEKKTEKVVEKKDSKGRQKSEKSPETHSSPFEENSAGHHVFMVLKKAKGHSIDTLVNGIEKRLDKYKDVKKPKDVKAKAKIIIGVINSGQKGKWGKFTDEKGKITYTAQ